MRGAAEPVDAFVLEGEGTVVSRLQASLRRGVSPFRGRDDELGLLALAWERAALGRGDAICLVGEPGIGKSRLIWELQRHLGLPDPVEGAAQAYARGAAYFAFRPLLRQLAALPPDADLATSREGLHRRLWDLSPDLAAFVPDVLPILTTSCETLTMFRDAPADGRRDRVQDAVVAWVEAECRRAPRLALVEDVH